MGMTMTQKILAAHAGLPSVTLLQIKTLNPQSIANAYASSPAKMILQTILM